MPDIKLNEHERIENGKLHIQENFQVKPKITKSQIFDSGSLQESKKEKKLVLKPRIEAIHAGRTRNHNIYPAERLKGDYKLKSGCYSFLYPYPKPMIKNHDQNTEPTGRITNAQFISDSATGKEAIIIIPEITDPETIDKVLDGRYLTVSIGATTDSAICNICGTDVINEGWCGHSRGEVYDGVEAGWIVGNLYFDECSWVNVPADSDAKVLDAGEPTVMEAYAQVGDKYYNLSSDNEQTEVKESEAKILGIAESVSQENHEEGGNEPVSKPAETVTVEKDEKVEDNIVEDNKVEDKTVEEQDSSEAKVVEGEVKTEDETTEGKVEEDAKLDETATELQEKDNMIAERDRVIAERDASLEEKDDTIKTLNESVTNLTSQVEELQEQNSQFKADQHKLLAETVIMFKETLGRPLPEDREQTLEEHLTRSEESLLDSLKDLRKEFGMKRTYSQKVENPALGAVDGEEHQEITESEEDSENTKTRESLTDDQVLVRLFSGRIK